jgi:hypothetical protein
MLINQEYWDGCANAGKTGQRGTGKSFGSLPERAEFVYL